jgi:hypothetical protein
MRVFIHVHCSTLSCRYAKIRDGRKAGRGSRDGTICQQHRREERNYIHFKQDAAGQVFTATHLRDARCSRTGNFRNANRLIRIAGTQRDVYRVIQEEGSICLNVIHPFCSLSYDRSVASSKASSPYSAI